MAEMPVPSTPGRKTVPSRKRRVVVSAVLACIVVLAGAVFIAKQIVSSEDPPGKDVGSLGYFEGREISYVASVRAFVVHEGKGLVAISAIDPHLGHRDLFCWEAQTFQGKHGELFDRVGHYIGGPAPRGLDRFALRVNEGEVFINTGTMIAGAPRRTTTQPFSIESICKDNTPEDPQGFFRTTK
jgi:nitrite reductase/ring-hydroxylating ferredoxin subunit